jgi:hypothetical protein
VKLVKQQINGNDHIVLKENASTEDLKAEVARLKTVLGYDVQPDKRRGRYIATHGFFRGKFLVALEQD